MHPVSRHWWFVAALGTLLTLSPPMLASTVCDDPPATAAPTPLDPKTKLAEAKPSVVYVATSSKAALDETHQETDTKLHYTFVLPEGFKPTQPRDMVIMLHGFGLDHTWAARTNPPPLFCTDKIVIAPDGTRESDDGKGFSPGLEGPDLLVLRDFVLEMTRTFPTGRIIIYGHSQGAFQALAFGNQFPRLVNGVVSHSGGLIAQMRLGGLKAVPTVFVHGTEDAVIPYRLSVDARDILLEKEAVITHLRRVYGHAHEANPAEAEGAINFCIAMSTDKPEVTLNAARLLLKPIGTNSPPFNLAVAALKRFEIDPEDMKAWPKGFKAATDEQKAEAKALILSIEAQGLRHIAELRKQLPDAAALKNATFEPDHPTPNWLGHILALREDFRGVQSVEDYLKEIGLDEAQDKHDEAARSISRVMDSPDWGGEGALPKEAYAIVLSTLPKAYLFEPMPGDLGPSMSDWHKRAESLHIPADRRDLYPIVTQYLGAVEKGRSAYRAINAQWQAPQPPPPPAPAPSSPGSKPE